MDDKRLKKILDKTEEKYKKIQMECSRQQEVTDSQHSELNKKKELKKLDKIKEKYSEISKDYAKAIFDYLSTMMPELVVRKTKETVSWESVFPESFSEITDDQVKSLIAIIEEDGGRYRLKSIEQ